MAHIPKSSRQSPYGDRRKPGHRVNRDQRYSSKMWMKLRLAWLKMHPTCVECGRLARVVDHIFPVTQGGDFWQGPFQSMCDSCHARKSRSEMKDQRII